MPSLRLVDTSLDPRPALRRWWVRILASSGVVLFALLAGATADAQTKHGKKTGAQEPAKVSSSKSPGAAKAKGAKGKGKNGPKASKDKAPESAKAPAAPRTFPNASTTPPRTPIDVKALAKQAAQHWKQITDTLLIESLARDPERAFERPWTEITERHLGTFGSGATLRWRTTLTDALTELQRFGAAAQPEVVARVRALRDWVEAELLLLDSRTPSTSDPSGYVQRAFRALRTAREVGWMASERRTDELEGLLRELPAYFEDARLSLIDPPAQWIDLALLELDDLQELVLGIEALLPAKPAARTPKARQAAVAEPDPRGALESFRSWLLELRPSAADRAPGPIAAEWQRLASLRSGTAWTANELKARCLRELARLDLGARAQRARKPDENTDVAALAWSASSSALELGREARLLDTKLAPEAVVFELEASSRTKTGSARLCVDDGDSSRVFLAEPHGSWTPERMITRDQRLKSAAAALGVRYGLAGEALFGLQSRAADEATAVLLDNRLLREGLGLYALDWTRRLTRRENPFRGNEDLAFEFEFQLGLEAARLVAALELHAEGLGLEEVAEGFERRTGVDRDTARAEALAAERDPLHGLGYLGLIELRALEERLGQLTEGRPGSRLCLELAARHPDLRPSDLVWLASRGPAKKRKGEETAARTLENPGQTQQELPRSR